MSEAAISPQSIERLHFVRGHPRQLARCLPEIRSLRKEHFQVNEDFEGRTPVEVERYVGELTDASWHDPTKITSTRPGQRYKHLRVVAAFDGEKELRGYAYTGINVSSKIEQRFYGNRFLRPAAIALGSLERAVKARIPKYQYAWTREIVRDPRESDKLEGILGALALGSYSKEGKPGLQGTLYPLSEEKIARNQLTTWGFKPDTRADGSPLRREVPSFGPASDPALQERWTVSDANQAINNMLEWAGVAELPDVKDLTLAA